MKKFDKRKSGGNEGGQAEVKEILAAETLSYAELLSGRIGCTQVEGSRIAPSAKHRRAWI